MPRWYKMLRIRITILAVGVCIPSLFANAAVIGPYLQAELAKQGQPHFLKGSKTSRLIPVIITFADKADVHVFKDRDKHRKRKKIVRALQNKANFRQQTVKAVIKAYGKEVHRSLWLINALAADVPARLVPIIARFPEVESLKLDYKIHIQGGGTGPPGPPEWNLTTIKVPDLWNMGVTGAGIVVANMDTGVDMQHPELAAKWLGGPTGWFDPNGEHPTTPYDADGHGTQTMGVMVGGDAGGTAIGAAPDAQWVAVKIFDDNGAATLSAIHQGFQWLLDPDGDPATADAPADVVNDSWGFSTNVNQCINEFASDIDALKTAGIAVVFSAGNQGPNVNTSISPANNLQGYAVGAVDSSLTIADFSSRGVSPCDTDPNAVFPEVVAPGVAIHTTDLSFGGNALYTDVSGTSFAAPQVSGVMALLLSAFPGTDVATLESVLETTAQDLDVLGPDNNYGYGLVDSVAAYNELQCPSTALDSDGDGIPDICDNCTLVANPDQRDSNNDLYGNLCDADLDNDGITNGIDVGIILGQWLTAGPDADFNGDNVVNGVDVGIFLQYWLLPPGPSGLAP